MITVGDVVQPRIGGPKLKVIEVHEDQIVAVPVHNDAAEKLRSKRLTSLFIKKRAISASANPFCGEPLTATYSIPTLHHLSLCKESAYLPSQINSI
jgi:hypothetical protein